MRRTLCFQVVFSTGNLCLEVVLEMPECLSVGKDRRKGGSQVILNLIYCSFCGKEKSAEELALYRVLYFQVHVRQLSEIDGLHS